MVRASGSRAQPGEQQQREVERCPEGLRILLRSRYPSASGRYVGRFLVLEARRTKTLVYLRRYAYTHMR